MNIHPAAAALRDRLTGALVAAAATPLPAVAGTDPTVMKTYFGGLIDDGADSLAICAHTGRGPLLAGDDRRAVINSALATGAPVLVGVTGPDTAAEAAALGAAGVLVFAPDGDALAAHDAIWQAGGLPLIAFDLFRHPYPSAVRDRLLEHPGVAGLKLARLHDAIACQDGIDASRAAGRLPLTGEDRMFGASLLWGADAALVGLAAAAVPTTASVLRAFRDERFAEFVAASAALDRFASVLFGDPVDGYVQRLLWIAAAEGRIPQSCATDPWAPALPADDQDRVLATWRLVVSP